MKVTGHVPKLAACPQAAASADVSDLRQGMQELGATVARVQVGGLGMQRHAIYTSEKRSRRAPERNLVLLTLLPSSVLYSDGKQTELVRLRPILT